MNRHGTVQNLQNPLFSRQHGLYSTLQKILYSQDQHGLQTCLHGNDRFWKAKDTKKPEHVVQTMSV